MRKAYKMIATVGMFREGEVYGFDDDEIKRIPKDSATPFVPDPPAEEVPDGQREINARVKR